MNRHFVPTLVALLGLAACGKQAEPPAPAAAQQAPAAEGPAQPAQTAEQPSQAPQAATAEPVEETTPADDKVISETEDGEQVAAATPAGAQPALQLGAAAAKPATSAQFKEGVHYQKLVPAQPSSTSPDKVEVVEVFWYGCPHCFALDPALESWRNKGKAAYVEFIRVPAMWDDRLRIHARIFYTAEQLGQLDTLHALIFREINIAGSQLNSKDAVAAFFQQHGVSAQDFDKTFSSFAVESKLQRADFLNRRYRVQAVPMFVVNGKYTTDVGMAGGEQQLLKLINELAASEHG
jgi:protein dithiol oxidoreductase (disulfide-forming)